MPKDSQGSQDSKRPKNSQGLPGAKAMSRAKAASGATDAEEKAPRFRVPGRIVASVVGGVLAVALLAGIAVWAFPVFKVSSFEVAGNSHVQASEVEQASGVVQGANLLRVDAREAASNVASIPWVKSVTVSRSLPSTLAVEITEHTAVAYVNSSDGTHLVDADGTEFVIDTPPEDAVELTGPVESGSQELKDAVDVASSLPQGLRAQVKTLEVKDAYSMTFTTKDGRTVFWGASEDNHNKAIAFEDVLKLEGQNWNISNPELVTSS